MNVNVYAFTQNATLDFTNLYANTNAGLYQMSVSFKSKTTVSYSDLKFSTRRDDNDLYCVTEAAFEVGQMEFTLTNPQTGWIFTTSKPVVATTSVQSENETCLTDISTFTGKQRLFSYIGLNQAIQLPVNAPFEYEKVATHLSPFNGYLNLNADVKVSGSQLVIDPSQMLTKKSITSQNKDNASVTYYVFASKEATSLSLGTGLVKF